MCSCHCQLLLCNCSLPAVAQLYELVYSGYLDGDMERKYWITPGEHYAVEVHCEDPCMELSQRQVWTWAKHAWE